MWSSLQYLSGSFVVREALRYSGYSELPLTRVRSSPGVLLKSQFADRIKRCLVGQDWTQRTFRRKTRLRRSPWSFVFCRSYLVSCRGRNRQSRSWLSHFPFGWRLRSCCACGSLLLIRSQSWLVTAVALLAFPWKVCFAASALHSQSRSELFPARVIGQLIQASQLPLASCTEIWPRTPCFRVACGPSCTARGCPQTW